MNKAHIVFDKASARTTDVDGRLHVARTHISKANVCPYYGSEIPGFEELGLDAQKVYKLWRHPDELAKAAPTFNNLPLLRRHVAVSADAPMKDDVVGSIGSDVVFNAPYLDASLSVWDSAAIAGIESEDQSELSSAYRYTPDMTPGTTPDGEPYDGVMRDIIGNHLALVEVGRAGPDVVVADSNPFMETPAMKKTKLGNALVVALSAASPKLAQDAALPKLVGGAVKSKFDKAAVKQSLIAMDSEFDPEQLDAIIDAILGVEQNPEPQQMGAGDNDPAMSGDPTSSDPEDNPAQDGDLAGYLASCGLSEEEVAKAVDLASPKAAEDEVTVNEPGEGDPAKMTHAMDALRKSLQAQYRDLDVAKADVRPLVGDVIGMDTGDQVYRFALDQMKVKHDGVSGKGLRTLFQVARDRSAPQAAPTIAQDAAAVKTVPGLGRFGKA